MAPAPKYLHKNGINGETECENVKHYFYEMYKVNETKKNVPFHNLNFHIS